MIDLVPGNCGHLLPAGMEPNVTIHGQPARVCSACLEGARSHVRPQVETKPVRPAAAPADPVEMKPATGVVTKGMPVDTPELDWADEGRRAALSGADRVLPEALRGLHPRSARPRAWFDGYDRAKAGQ